MHLVIYVKSHFIRKPLRLFEFCSYTGVSIALCDGNAPSDAALRPLRIRLLSQAGPEEKRKPRSFLRARTVVVRMKKPVTTQS